MLNNCQLLTRTFGCNKKSSEQNEHGEQGPSTHPRKWRKWVDFRFTDTKGKEQHVTYPADTIDEDTFEDGKMFDGSSIAGWKGIEASDMILRPDAETGFLDPFFAEAYSCGDL